jgi:ATP-dependent RNA helicase HelY
MSEPSSVAAFAATLPWPLDHFQVEAMEKLDRSRALVVSAPTSSGKTVVADYAIWSALQAADQRSRVIYTTPLKALSNQKYHELSVRYGAERVGLVTGEHTLNDSAPVVVMTTEILRNVLYDEPERLRDVSNIVLDEIHFIDEYPRGTVWEEIIIQTPQHIKLIGLSATISNADEVAAWMTKLRGPCEVVLKTDRPVELKVWLALRNQLYQLFDSQGRVDHRTFDRAQNEEMHGHRGRFSPAGNDLLRLIEELSAREMVPAIYFIFSRKGCREALARCGQHGLDLTTDNEKAGIDAYVASRMDSVTDGDERRVFEWSLGLKQLRRGLAMHHAGMLPYAKETIELLFQQGLVKVVFATETLSLGLNMPARACVISSFTKFDGTGFSTLTSSEVTQLTGRAGRRGIDELGHGIILKDSDVDIRDIYDAVIAEEMVVESKFAPTYSMTLNLLKNHSVEQSELLLEKSFGQYQNRAWASGWQQEESRIEGELLDLTGRVFRHPQVPCTEDTLSGYLRSVKDLSKNEKETRQLRRSHRRSDKRDFSDKREQVQQLRASVRDSPCHRCPYLVDHRAHRNQVEALQEKLEQGRAEVEEVEHRFRNQFRQFRLVLQDGGFLKDDVPTPLGELAGSLYGENSLLIAQGLTEGWFSNLNPQELAAALALLVTEERGRKQPGSSFKRFPTSPIEGFHRAARSCWRDLSVIENEHGLETLRELAYDFIQPTYEWAGGVALADIATPPGSDLGDVVKAVKNVYSMLRQMEQATRRLPIHAVIAEARGALEREMIVRV